MSKNYHLVTLDMDCEAAISLIRSNLSAFGVRTLRSFDLKSACATYPDLTCAHHEDVQCDCQLVVLLAYGMGKAPVTLTVHSNRGHTEIELVSSPSDRPNKNLEATIRRAIAATVDMPTYSINV